MAYVSARYGPPDQLMPDAVPVIATDDQGREWWLTEDSQVGDWLEFVANGGTIDPYEEPPA